MRLKLQTKSIENNILFYALIVLACMNFFEEGALLTLILGVWFLCKCHFKFEMDGMFFCMLAMTLSVIGTSLIYGRAYVEYLKAFNFVLIYIVGRRGYSMAEDKEAFIKRTMFAVFVGFFFQLILQYGYNLGKTYERARMLYSIWTGRPIAVTLIGLLSAALIGYSFYGLFLCKRKFVKILSAVSLILTIIVNLASATRTPIYLTIVSFTVMAVVYFSDNASENAKGRLRVFSALLVIVLGVLIAYETNAFNLKTYVDSSALLGRISYTGIQTERTVLFIQFNRLMPQYPWGGGYIREIVGRSAHNYLQESYDLYGVISFIALLGITVHMLMNFIKLLMIKGKKDYHFLVISVGLTLFVQCCLEPVMTGYPVALWMLILIHGMTTSHLKAGDYSRKIINGQQFAAVLNA